PALPEVRGEQACEAPALSRRDDRRRKQPTLADLDRSREELDRLAVVPDRRHDLGQVSSPLLCTLRDLERLLGRNRRGCMTGEDRLAAGGMGVLDRLSLALDRLGCSAEAEGLFRVEGVQLDIDGDRSATEQLELPAHPLLVAPERYGATPVDGHERGA